MASTQQLADADTHLPAANAPAIDRRSYLRYLLWAALIPSVLWLLAFPLVCSRSYERWGETEWGPVLEYPYEAGTPDADVVIWGDSSAFIGVDPRLVNQQLGIRSVVLPSTVGSLPVMGDGPLRNYLAHHKQPTLIVLYFSPWNLDFNHMAPGRHFEGEEMMMRHGTAREIALYALRHPFEIFAFPTRLYSTFGSKMLVEFLHGKSREQETLASLGHAPYAEPYPPLGDLCRIPSAYLKQYGTQSVEQLRDRYRTPGTQVMVYLAPVPDCTNSGSLGTRSFASLGAAAPVRMPPTDFADDPYYTHIRPSEVPASSAVFANALKEHLQQVAPQLLQATAPNPQAATLP